MGDLLHLPAPPAPTANDSDEICALYRAFSRSGRLLYIGISNQPDVRAKQHAAGKSWWTEVDRIDIEWHPDRHHAEQAERTAIRTEQPFYNLIRYGAERPDGFKRRPTWEACRARNIPYVLVWPHHGGSTVAADLDTTRVEPDPMGPWWNTWDDVDPDGVLQLLLQTASRRVLERHDSTVHFGAGGSHAHISYVLREDADPVADAFVDWWTGGTRALELLIAWDAA